MEERLLRVNNLRIGFHTQRGFLFAVDAINFSIAKGKTYALLGESGSGKSITALSLLQLLPQQADYSDDSEIVFQGDDLLTYPEITMRKVRGRRIAMIFQDAMSALNPVLTVEQQLREVLTHHTPLQAEALHERMIELLKQVGIASPEQRLTDFPHQLSGGMKQRVMIAIALAGNPELLIADEPTTALDVTIQAQVLQLLRDIQARTQMAILLITHDLGVVHQMADHVGVMYAGQLVEEAPVHRFFETPLHPYSQKLFLSQPDLKKRAYYLSILHGHVPPISARPHACRFAPRCDFAWDDCNKSVPKWLEMNAGSHVRCHLYDEEFRHHTISEKQIHEPAVADSTLQPTDVLTARNLKVYFPIKKGVFRRTIGYVKAVDGVNLKLRAGKTLALVGESGCGKTTVGRALLGLIQPTEGEINFINKPDGNLAQYVQIIFQDPFTSMNPRMLVSDIIAEGVLNQKNHPRLHDLDAFTDELLQQVGLPSDIKSRYPHEFSGGQRQRIAIARALAVQPKIIICDEPTSALDVSVQAQILNLLKKLQREHGLTYLFITHNMAVVSYLADEVAVMYLGRIVEEGNVLNILERPHHPYTQALLAAVPDIHEKTRMQMIAHDEMPSAMNPPSGCHFHPRCSHAMGPCKSEYPDHYQISDSHNASCYLYKLKR